MKEKKQKQRQKQRQKQSQNVRVVVNIPSEKKPRKRRAPRKKPIEESVIEPQLFRQLPPVVYMPPPQVTHYAGGFPREDFVSVPIAEKPSISIEPVSKPAKILGAEPKSLRFEMGTQTPPEEFIRVPIAESFKKENLFALKYPFMETPVALEESPQMVKPAKMTKMEKSKPIQPPSAPILQMPEQPKPAPSLGEAVMSTARTVEIPLIKSTPILQMPEQPKTAPSLGEAVMETGRTVKIPRIKSTPSILQPQPEPSVPILEEPPAARLSILQPADIAPAMATGEEEIGVSPEMIIEEGSARKETRGRPRSIAFDLARATRATIEEIYINEVGRPTTGMSRADMIKEIIYKRENP